MPTMRKNLTSITSDSLIYQLFYHIISCVFLVSLTRPFFYYLFYRNYQPHRDLCTRPTSIRTLFYVNIQSNRLFLFNALVYHPLYLYKQKSTQILSFFFCFFLFLNLRGLRSLNLRIHPPLDHFPPQKTLVFRISLRSTLFTRVFLPKAILHHLYPKFYSVFSPQSHAQTAIFFRMLYPIFLNLPPDTCLLTTLIEYIHLCSVINNMLQP